MTPQITHLSNGVRVVSETFPGAESVIGGVWVGTGSRLESPAQNGIAHFLEHMAFKGTTTRSALQIAEAIENVGGDLNAHTSSDFTAYYAHTLGEDLPLTMNILSDILHNSTFEERELAVEKGVILQEIARAEDQPEQVAGQGFYATSYPGQSLGRPILGPPENVKRFQPQDFRDFMDAYYHPERMVVAAAGAVDHAALVRLTEEHFQLPKSAKTIAVPEAQYVGGANYLTRPLQQVSFIVGFEGVSFEHPNYYTFSLLSQILGGGMASRLFQEIREKHGLVYSIYSFSSSYADTGLFGIAGGTGPEEVRKLMPLLAETLHKATDSITEEELERARAQVRAYLLMSRDSIGSRAHTLGESMLARGRIVPREETLEKVNAVSRHDVMNVLNGLLKSPPTVTLVGDLTHAEPFESFSGQLRGTA